MTKRWIVLFLSVVMVCSLLIPTASAAEAGSESTPENIMATYYVSPDGNDGNSGKTVQQAFRSVKKARETVRTINSNMTGDIVVYLMDGTWELDETLRFDQKDSGTNGHNIWYKAYDGTSPMLSGGTKLTGEWEQTTVNGSITAYKTTLERNVKLRAIYVNGERRYMAHTENSVYAQGSWGTCTIGNVPEVDDFNWKEVYSENFETDNVAVGGAENAIQKYAKSGAKDNAILNVVENGQGGHTLQIAHTANEDCGFEIPSVTYRNALITYRVQFASDHKFTHEWEALHMHGANRVIDGTGRTTWAGIKFAPHLNQTYFQYGTSGGQGADAASTQTNTTAFSAEPGVWYKVKMMVTDDGYFFTKVWKDGDEEPTDWSRRETFSNLNNQDKFLRIYAYKNNDNSKMDVRVDDIVIQTGTKNAAVGEETLPEWAWNTGSKFDGLLYRQSDIPRITKNVADVEIENQQTWNKNTVCVREIEAGTNGTWILKLQQPYGAIAQTPGWNVNFSANGHHVLHNAYEFLNQPGEFYFDRAEKTLYYIPMDGENINTAEVVVPRLETVVEFRGTPTVSGAMNQVGADNKTITGQVKNIIFDGISVAYSDWNLQKVGDSYGKSTVQAGTVYTAFASGNWHADMYRNLDILPGAVEMEYAHDIRFMNGEIKLTGAEGAVLANDVDGCQVIGNFIYQTGGGGVLVGHPQHIYENDSLEPDTYYYHHVEGDGKPAVSGDGATANHEKYQNGTERAPRDVKVANNFLLENCRLFPSHCPITSYYTQRLEVSNNFIKDAAYSGMSIGWGWGNFDGETNGERWGTENNQGYAIIPNIPTNVCKDNKVINNRVENAMTILHDGGLFYTLGKQNDTELTGNYGNGSEQGIYQDEGSAYFKPIRDNVVANVSGRAIHAGAYGRKHDLQYVNNYSNSNIIESVPQYNVTIEDFHYIADSVWPKEASDIIQNSGLTAEYRAHFSDQLVDAYGMLQDALLPQKVLLAAGEKLTLNAWLDAEDEIWLAPAETSAFAEGVSMSKAAGNAKEMAVPLVAGDYYLYVKRAGTFTPASKAYVHVDNTAGDIIPSVEPGTYGEPQQVELAATLDSATLYYSTDGSEPTLESNKYTDTISITTTTTLKVASYKEGERLTARTFLYYIVDLTNPIPDKALIHLSADKNVTVDECGAVSAWADANHKYTLTQTNSGAQPKLVMEGDVKAVRFDGADDYLGTTSFVDMNDKTSMTVIMVGRQIEEKYPVDPYGDMSPVVSMPQSDSWGGIYFNPKINSVLVRFGVGPSVAGSGVTTYTRPAGETQFSSTVAIKDKETDTIYINGTKVYQTGGRAEKITNTQAALYLAKGRNENDYFHGDIAELLIYDRVLTEEEVLTVSRYLRNKYLNVTPPTASPDAGTFYEAQTVTLSCTTPGAEIYYTIDGTTPTKGSRKYTEPFRVTETTTVKTMAVRDGWNSGKAEFAYIVSGPTYIVAADAVSHGEITVSAETAKPNDTIRIALTPDSGYQLKAGSLKAFKTGVPDTMISITDNQFIMPDYNVTVTAEFEAIQYTISYVLDGGVNAAGNPAEYTAEDSFALEEPTKSGYTFTGWTYGDVTVPVKSVSIASGTMGDLSFTAHWTKNTPPSGGAALPPGVLEAIAQGSNKNGFLDVKPTDWFAEAVQYAVDKGLMNGTAEKHFDPNEGTTRGMIVTILYRQAGSPAVRNDGRMWWSAARAWAIANGVSDGSNMDSRISREQLAVMLYRYAELTGRDISGKASLEEFTDGSKVSSYAVRTMQWAVSEELISGKGSGLLDPQAGATRAETAMMFMRFTKK